MELLEAVSQSVTKRRKRTCLQLPYALRIRVASVRPLFTKKHPRNIQANAEKVRINPGRSSLMELLEAVSQSVTKRRKRTCLQLPYALRIRVASVRPLFTKKHPRNIQANAEKVRINPGRSSLMELLEAVSQSVTKRRKRTCLQLPYTFRIRVISVRPLFTKKHPRNIQANAEKVRINPGRSSLMELLEAVSQSVTKRRKRTCLQLPYTFRIRVISVRPLFTKKHPRNIQANAEKVRINPGKSSLMELHGGGTTISHKEERTCLQLLYTFRIRVISVRLPSTHTL